MPTVPTNKKCRELGCKNDRTYISTSCVEHGGGINAKAKKNNKLYGNKFWEKQRMVVLSKEPLCASCLSEGRVNQAYHVDHVFPHRQDPVKFKINLFQSLCVSCHTLKTQQESQGTYLYWTKHGLVTYTEGDYKRIFG